MHYLQLAGAWLYAHQILWPLVTALITLLFGSAEKYAATHPRAAKLLALVQAAGFDASGVRQKLFSFAKKSAGAAVLLVGLGLGVELVEACSASLTPEQKQLEGEQAKCLAASTALQAECISLYDTDPEITACRQTVQSKYDCADAGSFVGSDGSVVSNIARAPRFKVVLVTPPDAGVVDASPDAGALDGGAE